MSDVPTEETQKTKQIKKGAVELFNRLYRPVPLILIFLVLISFLAGIGVHLLRTKPVPPILEDSVVDNNSVSYDLAFEEHVPLTSLNEKVRQADFILLDVIRESGFDLEKLEILDVSKREHDGKDYYTQTIHLPGNNDKLAFMSLLGTMLESRLGSSVMIADNGTNDLALVIDGVVTHSLLLDEQVAPAPSYADVKGPKLIIVIDDIGEDLSALKRLVALDYPVVCAVWPRSSKASQAAAIVRESGRDLLVHFPMQPKGFPKVKPGPGALLVGMSAEEIRGIIKQNLGKVEGAIGVNNHMGSQFTEDRYGMTIALQEFKKNGLFFLDSRTTPKTVGESVAEKIAIPFYKRDVFIDNVHEVDAVIHQLRKAERIAKKTGQAIAIGHPHKETVAALEKWASVRDSNVTIISLSTLKPM